tara:strand:+ start:347 stop:859 length:513 start_codon:yes stop_codon:yes gene_type:complete
MDTNYTSLLAGVFDEKIVAVLGVLLSKRNEFGVRELAREAQVSTATTYRIIQKLKALGIIAKAKHGKSVSYTLKKDSKAFNQICSLIIGPKPEPIDVLRKSLDSRIGANNYRLLIRGQGTNKKTFVVSDKLTEATHSEISSTIEVESGRKLAFATISIQQLKQMQDMGLL